LFVFSEIQCNIVTGDIGVSEIIVVRNLMTLIVSFVNSKMGCL